MQKLRSFGERRELHVAQIEKRSAERGGHRHRLRLSTSKSTSQQHFIPWLKLERIFRVSSKLHYFISVFVYSRDSIQKRKCNSVIETKNIFATWILSNRLLSSSGSLFTWRHMFWRMTTHHGGRWGCPRATGLWTKLLVARRRSAGRDWGTSVRGRRNLRWCRVSTESSRNSTCPCLRPSTHFTRTA